MGSKTWLLLQVWITCSALVVAIDLSPKDVQIDVQSLWTDDENRAREGQIVLDFQKHTKYDQNEDLSKNPLFKSVDEELLKKPTYQALIEVFNAYDAPGRLRTPARLRASLENFLDKISETSTFKDLQKLLKGSGYAPASDDAEFRKALTEMWFGEYPRAHQTSSGFEHVFVGEVKHRHRVDGLHNWVRMYWLESKKKTFDYAGFIFKQPRVAVIKFQLGDHWKEAGSMMIGTSPEFDFAVFTLCFVGKRGSSACKFFLGDCSPVDVTSFDIRGTKYIGTTYPKPWKTHAQCPVKTPTADATDDSNEEKGGKHREEMLAAFGEQKMMGKLRVDDHNNSTGMDQIDETVDVDYNGEWKDDWEISSEKWFEVDED